jgi:hypothetical protein
MHIKLIDCVTAKAVMGRPFSAEAQVRFQISTCHICGGQSGTGARFVSLPFHRCSVHCNVTLFGRTIGQRIENVFNDDLYSTPEMKFLPSLPYFTLSSNILLYFMSVSQVQGLIIRLKKSGSPRAGSRTKVQTAVAVHSEQRRYLYFLRNILRA